MRECLCSFCKWSALTSPHKWLRSKLARAVGSRTTRHSIISSNKTSQREVALEDISSINKEWGVKAISSKDNSRIKVTCGSQEDQDTQ